MPFGYAALAISAYGAYSESQAGEAGADAQQNAADAATAEERRQYDQTRQDMMPWLNAGSNALTQQQNFLNGDWSGFENSNDYKWAVDQGFKGLDRGAARNGNLWGGAADADRIALGQGLATQYAGNYYSKLAGLSNTGQGTANQLGQFGQQTAQNIGQYGIGAGQARASSYANSANAWSNFGNQALNAYGQSQGWGG